MKAHYAIGPLALLMLFAACKKDKNEVTTPAPEANEEELITSLEVHLYRLDGSGDTSIFAFRDLDGPGGAEPQPIDTITLDAGTTYGCFLRLLDESSTHVDNITAEIENESDEHLFCFTPSAADLSIVRTDSDGTFEIGLQSAWTTGAASSGDLTITLKHQPGVKNGSCEPGETDIEVTFPVDIQ